MSFTCCYTSWWCGRKHTWPGRISFLSTRWSLVLNSAPGWLRRSSWVRTLRLSPCEASAPTTSLLMHPKESTETNETITLVPSNVTNAVHYNKPCRWHQPDWLRHGNITNKHSGIVEAIVSVHWPPPPQSFCLYTRCRSDEVLPARKWVVGYLPYYLIQW